MTILDFNEYKQIQPLKQITPINPGSYNDFVNANSLDPNKDQLLKYSRVLAEYKLGYLAMQKCLM